MIAPSDRQTALEFKRRVTGLVPMVQLCCIGSRARGDATAESDLDVFLVVDHINANLREKISEVAWEVGFANDLVLSNLCRYRASSCEHARSREGSVRLSARSKRKASGYDGRAAQRACRGSGCNRPARRCARPGFWRPSTPGRGAVSRAYYAMFYGVLALLATKGLGSSKHSGTISLFDREFVKPGDSSQGIVPSLHMAFERRQAGGLRRIDRARRSGGDASDRRGRDHSSKKSGNLTCREACFPRVNSRTNRRNQKVLKRILWLCNCTIV